SGVPVRRTAGYQRRVVRVRGAPVTEVVVTTRVVVPTGNAAVAVRAPRARPASSPPRRPGAGHSRLAVLGDREGPFEGQVPGRSADLHPVGRGLDGPPTGGDVPVGEIGGGHLEGHAPRLARPQVHAAERLQVPHRPLHAGAGIVHVELR